MCRTKFRLWLKATVNSAFGNVRDWQAVAKRRSYTKQLINKAVTVIRCDRFFCVNVPIQIRRSDGLILAQPPLSAVNYVGLLQKIKPLRYSVTAFGLFSFHL